MGIANVNLKRYVDSKGWGLAEVVHRLGRSNSFWSDRLANREGKNIGAVLARDIEEKLDLPRYWLDEDHGSNLVQFPVRPKHHDEHISAVIELMEELDARGKMEAFAAVRSVINRYLSSRTPKASGGASSA